MDLNLSDSGSLEPKSVELLEKENRDLRRNLKLESVERDNLERENIDLQRQVKQVQKKIKQLEDDLDRESKERDVLDKENANTERRMRSLELEIKSLKQSLNIEQEDVLRLKGDKSKLQKKLDDVSQESEKELDKLRDELRAAKRETREKVKKVEAEKEDLERELKRAASYKKYQQQVASLERDLQTAQQKIRFLQTSGSSSTTSSSGVSETALNELLEEKTSLLKKIDALEEKLTSSNEKGEDMRKQKDLVDVSKKEFEQEIKTLKDKLAEEERKAKSHEHKSMDLELNISELKVQLKNNTDELQRLKEHSQQDDKDRVISELRLLAEESSHNVQELQSSNEELDQKVSQLKVDLAESDEENKKLFQTIVQLQTQLKAAEEKVSSTGSAEDTSKLKKKHEKELSELQEQLQSEQKQRKQDKDTIESLNDELSKLKKENVVQTNKFNELQLAEADSKEKVKQLQASLDEERKAFQSNMEASVKKFENEVRELNSTLAEFKEKVEKLQQHNHKQELELEQLKQSSRKDKESSEQEREQKTSLQNDMNDLQKQLEDESKEKNKLKKASEKLEDQLNEITEQLNREKNESEKDKKKYEQQIQTLNATNEQLEQQRDSLTQAEAKLNKQVQELQSQVASLEKVHKESSKSDSDKQQFQVLQAEKEQAESQRKKLQQENDELQSAVAGIKREQQQLESAKKALETQLQDLRDELADEKELGEQAIKMKKTLEKDIDDLEEKLDAEIALREAEVKQRKDIHTELQTIQSEFEAAKQEKQLAIKQREDLLSQVNKLSEERSAAEKEKSKVEQSLKELSTKLDFETSLKQTLALEKKQLQADLARAEDMTNSLKQQSDSGTQLQVQLEDLNNQNQSLKRQLEEAKRAETKVEELTKSLNEEKIKNLRNKEKRESLKKAASTLTDLEVLRAELNQVRKQADKQTELEQENAKLRQEIEALKQLAAEQGSTETETSEPAAASTGPKLTMPRRAAPPRMARKGTTTVGNAEPEATPSTPPAEATTRKPDIAAMGGVNLFGGLNINAEALAKPKLASPSTKREDDGKKRLFQLKGRRRVRTFQVELSVKSLNKGDVFVLDIGTKIYQWNGSESNRLERTKAKDITARLNRQKANKGEIISLDEDDKDEPEMFQFWKEFGGKAEVQSAQAGGDDLDAENQIDATTKLYRVTEDNTLDLIEGKLIMEMLDSNGCFVLDCVSEVHVWIGKNSSKELRNIAIAQGEKVLASENRPSWVELYRCAEGGETVVFCEKFSNWPDGATLGPQKFMSNVAQSKKQEKIDVIKMHYAEPPATWEDKELDLTEGFNKVEIWIVNEAVKEEIPAEQYGQFCSHHSYIVAHSYGSEGSPSSVVYFWQGRDCNKNEKGTSAALSMNLAKKMRGASQIRVVQYKEPKQFLKLFKGKLITHRMKKDDKFTGPAMYQISGLGDSVDAASATQVRPMSQLLNSRHSFVVLSSTGIYIWHGQHSSQNEHETANKVLEALSKDYGYESQLSTIKVIQEGQESSEFWSILGGKAEYSRNIKPDWAPKVFYFSTASGMVTAEPLFRYSQDDFIPENVLLVDNFSEVYVWMGAKSRENEKKIAMETAIDYLSKAPEQRPNNAQVLTVKDGSETLNFIGLFVGWDTQSVGGQAESASEALKEYSKTYTLQELKNKDALPKTVDKSKLEMYLSNEEFKQTFGVDKEEWTKLPQWKQLPKKKDAGLY